jgi:hypothetical protein
MMSFFQLVKTKIKNSVQMRLTLDFVKNNDILYSIFTALKS